MNIDENVIQIARELIAEGHYPSSRNIRPRLCKLTGPRTPNEIDISRTKTRLEKEGRFPNHSINRNQSKMDDRAKNGPKPFGKKPGARLR